MAAIALLISLGGLTISLLTYLRGRAPRPKWVTKVSVRQADDGERAVTATATNRGRGTAHDAMLVRDELQGIVAVFSRSQQDRVQFGETLRSSFTVTPDGYGDARFRLTWSEEPHLHRQRVKMLSVHLAPSPNATSRRARRNQ